MTCDVCLGHLVCSFFPFCWKQLLHKRQFGSTFLVELFYFPCVLSSHTWKAGCTTAEHKADGMLNPQGFHFRFLCTGVDRFLMTVVVFLHVICFYHTTKDKRTLFHRSYYHAMVIVSLKLKCHQSLMKTYLMRM